MFGVMVLSVMMAAPVSAQSNLPNFEETLRAFRNAEYDKAIGNFMRLGNAGDARAQYYVAYMMDIGAGITQSHFQAANWYRRAAEQGYVPAEAYLGYLYDIAHHTCSYCYLTSQ